MAVTVTVFSKHGHRHNRFSDLIKLVIQSGC